MIGLPSAAFFGLPLGRAHEAGLFLATLAAYLIVLLGGELPVVAWLVVVTPAVSALLKAKGLAAPGGSGTALGVASLALGVAQIARGGIDTAVLGGGITLLGLLTARMVTRRTLDHDLQALLLSLILVLAGSVLNVGINYGVLFVVYALSAIWALTTRQLLAGAERDAIGDEAASADAVRTRRDVVTLPFLVATGGVALFVLATTGLVFFAFPRIGVGNLGLSSNRSGGFPTAVSLRGSPRAAVGSNEVVARVFGVPAAAFERGLYLRGGVYDVVSEAGFAQSEAPPKLGQIGLHLVDAPAQGAYEMFLTPVAGDLLLSLGRVFTARVLQGGRANPSFRVDVSTPNVRGELVATAALQSGVRYEVRGGVATPGYVPNERNDKLRFAKDEHRSFFLALPEDLDGRLPALVAQLVGDTPDPVERVKRLRTHLLSGFMYTLEQPSGSAARPLIDFLFSSRAGHCEYFATAFATMLRVAGVPARVVGGYQGGQWDEESGAVLFRGRNAHAWVEWWLDGAGWITDDPTPAVGAARESLTGLDKLLERVGRFWDDSILDYAFSNQLDSLRAARGFFSSFSFEPDADGLARVGVGGAAVIALLVLGLRIARRRRAPVGEHALVRALREAMRRLGRDVRDEETMREAAAALPGGDARAAVLDAVALYEALRFGGAPLAKAEIQAAVRQLDALEPS